MTGIANLYLLVTKPHKRDSWIHAFAPIRAFFAPKYEHTRFVVLSWKRTGSNLLCGILFNHPEIAMHNELFNPIDIFSYYQNALIRNEEGEKWNVLGRDLYPEAFLEHIWTGRDIHGQEIKQGATAIGFKSFPDHWWEARNDGTFQDAIMNDMQVKKVVLMREDELAVYVSMKRAEKTGLYMTQPYPKNLKIKIDPAAFRIFIDNYRDTFRRRYKSSMEERTTFRISYEQLQDLDTFEADILPLLWDFLGVENGQRLRILKETKKQAAPNEDLKDAVENYDELEFCFRHTDVKHFSQRGHEKEPSKPMGFTSDPETKDVMDTEASWSILLPICSRMVRNALVSATCTDLEEEQDIPRNRLSELNASSQYQVEPNPEHAQICWENLQRFADSLKATCTEEERKKTECIVGIDEDDKVFCNEEARIKAMLQPCNVEFQPIGKNMYGRVCRIWSHLATKAKNDFIVLLGDDIVLKDFGWQRKIARKFFEIHKKNNLPFGAACVAMNDISFPGFPTFPVVHRWHIEGFSTILPRQFVNQGGDPYLYELYSRFNAACFAIDCRVENTIGGDVDARYKKHEINWRGQILRLNLMHMRGVDLLGCPETGICLDVVVPSFRVDNNEILEKILTIGCSWPVYVKFWVSVDNPDERHVENVKALAKQINERRFNKNGNYFISVLHYGENRGASFARNLGYNYSTADWCLFLDDDVVPDEHLLDAYVGAIMRYPKAKVFVGNTQLPTANNTWTKMLRTCNIMFFYGISKHYTFPPWGVTANLMVRGSRHNSTIQFKSVYPKTGGGEDIDLCFQFKEWYAKEGISPAQVIVGVPGATARHPWWNNGNMCYKQINGWARGDSLCLTEWPRKVFTVFPNWIEYTFFLVGPMAFCLDPKIALLASTAVAAVEHILLAAKYYPSACRHSQWNVLFRLFVAFGAGTVLSFQEVTRVFFHLYRGNWHCLCRRIDWNDGQDPHVKLDVKVRSAFHFAAYVAITLVTFEIYQWVTGVCYHEALAFPLMFCA